MSAKILAFDQSKRVSKIGVPPIGKVILSLGSANIISLKNLSPSVQKAIAFRQALKEIANLNETII